MRGTGHTQVILEGVTPASKLKRTNTKKFPHPRTPLPRFATLELEIRVDVQPRMFKQLSSRAAGVVVDPEHGQQEVAQLVRVALTPAVLFDHHPLQGPRLQVADVPKIP